MKLLESLKIDNKIVNYTENQTKEEAAFICNKLNPVKTNRELPTLVHNIVFENCNQKNNLVREMNYG